MGEYRNTPNFKEFILLQRSYSVSSKLDSSKLTVKLLQYCWLNNVVIMYSYHVWKNLVYIAAVMAEQYIVERTVLFVVWRDVSQVASSACKRAEMKTRGWMYSFVGGGPPRRHVHHVCVCVRGGGLLHLLFRVLRTVMEWPRTGGFNICRFNVNMYT